MSPDEMSASVGTGLGWLIEYSASIAVSAGISLTEAPNAGGTAV